MLSLRSHALITGGFFAAILLIGWGGNLLDAFGLVPDSAALRIAVLVVMLGFCAALAFSAVPLIVLIVLQFQVAAGNANRPIIRSLVTYQRAIVFVMWGLMAAGLALAVPAAILGGAFDTIEFRR
jgi:hypothetical protein